MSPYLSFTSIDCFITFMSEEKFIVQLENLCFSQQIALWRILPRLSIESLGKIWFSFIYVLVSGYFEVFILIFIKWSVQYCAKLGVFLNSYWFSAHGSHCKSWDRAGKAVPQVVGGAGLAAPRSLVPPAPCSSQVPTGASNSWGTQLGLS